jgi:arylsulfatase
MSVLFPRSSATVAEILRQHGYSTAMFGKNHNTPSSEAGPTGPFNHWPTGMGFDYFYGFNGWGTSNWHPMLFENTQPVATSSDPAYHLTTDLVERSIGWMRGQSGACRNAFAMTAANLQTAQSYSSPFAPKQSNQNDDTAD